jgi:hypothetical protein
MTWQPIKTAPRDGTRILLTDLKLLAVGYLAVSVEPDTKHDYDRWSREHEQWKRENEIPDPKYDGLFSMPKPGAAPLPNFHVIANPKAGERSEWWCLDGCSALVDGADCYDYDGPKYFEPTHWMSLPEPPK